MVTLNDIKEASCVVGRVAHNTPLIYSYSLSEMTGADVYLKLENLQRTGSFKIRGAFNKLWKLRDRVSNVIAASAGNHAQGVAVAASLTGIRATVVMPEGTPINKILAVRSYGADVVLKGSSFDEAFSHASDIQKNKDCAFIHPFDDYDIIAGQGTTGLEITESNVDADCVIVPVGGGGLISGISVAMKSVRREVEIFGVQAEAVPSMSLSLERGDITEPDSAATIADGIAVKRVGRITFGIVKEHVTGILNVTESQIEESLLILSQEKKLVVEGAGAAGLAGLLGNTGRFSGRKVVIIVSGGNIDINVLGKVIERGMVKSGRMMKLEVELPDMPGALGRLSTLLGRLRANVIQIYHDRLSKGLALDKAIVEITVETMNFEHQEEILEALRNEDYNPVR